MTARCCNIWSAADAIISDGLMAQPISHAFCLLGFAELSNRLPLCGLLNQDQLDALSLSYVSGRNAMPHVVAAYCHRWS